MSTAADDPEPGSPGLVLVSDMSTVVQFSPLRPHEPEDSAVRPGVHTADWNAQVCSQLTRLKVPAMPHIVSVTIPQRSRMWRLNSRYCIYGAIERVIRSSRQDDPVRDEGGLKTRALS